MTDQHTEASPFGSDLDNRRTRARVLQRAVPPPEDDQLTWRYAAHMVASDSLDLCDALKAAEAERDALVARLDAEGWNDPPPTAVQIKALLRERDALRDALVDMVDWAERYRGGDEKLHPEEFYIRRDQARAALAGTQEDRT